MAPGHIRIISFFLLAIATQKATVIALTDESPLPLHPGVLAMQAGHFEGDIVLPKEGRAEDVNGSATSPKLWKDGVIPYVVDRILSRTLGVGVVDQAIEYIQSKSCLRFVERRNEPDYIYLFPGDGCFSYVGRHGGAQPVSLGRGCLYLGTVMHELLHAAGFYHEHTRPDRDYYIKIIPENVMPGFLPIFDKREWNETRLLTRFDMQSVMMYGSLAFAIDSEHPTILTKDDDWLIDVHEKKELSPIDVERIQILYGCEQ